MRHALTGCLLRGLMILLVFSSSASSQTTATAQINGIGTVITNEQVLELPSMAVSSPSSCSRRGSRREARAEATRLAAARSTAVSALSSSLR